jgi:hypothetical protein
MREITSVFGLPEKPMEVTVPKDLVFFFKDSNLLFVILDVLSIAYYYNV